MNGGQDGHIPRRSFIYMAGVAGLGGAGKDRGGAPLLVNSMPTTSFPQHDPERVRSVVGASHSNLDRVRELVTEQPALAKAAWDWGFGDWESALGAASHTGRRQIAEFLIGHGARPTVFSSAMLGNVDSVRAFLEADPSLFGLPGPHGISLMRHAQAGGADAGAVVDYLSDRFGPDEIPYGFPGDDAVAATYGGEFRFDAEPPFTFKVGVRNEWLLVGAGSEPNSRVLQLEDHVFHPTGAPAVRLRFRVKEGRALSLTIEDGPFVMTGRRVGDPA